MVFIANDSNFSTALTYYFGGSAGSSTPSEQTDIGTYSLSPITISTWDTSAVTDMSRAFRNKYDFNEDISSWDVSVVTDMSYMFKIAYVSDQYISVWSLNPLITTYELTNMFQNATAMTTIYGADPNFGDTPSLDFFGTVFVPSSDAQFSASIAYYFDDTDDVLLTENNKKEIKAANGIGKWNTSGISNMNALFQGKTNFNEDLKDWNVSGVTDMKNMFNGATNFSKNISHWKPHADCKFGNMFTGTAMEAYTYIDGFDTLT